jgi:hypothetical protein
MLTSISLENFKSWKRIADMRLAPLTGLFGTNSSGKTSILQLLLMLKQTAESSDRNQVLNLGDQRSLVELGTFRDILHNHSHPGRIQWKLSWTLPNELTIPDPSGGPMDILFQGDKLTFDCEVVDEDTPPIHVSKMVYSFAEHEFLYEKKAAYAYKLIARGPDDFEFTRTRGRVWDLPAPVKCYGFPDQIKSYYQNAGFLADLAREVEKFFENLYYLGPLREYPKRQYIWAGARPADMGARGEKVIDALLSSREAKERISRGKGKPRFTVEEYAAYWLRELRLIHDFQVKPVTQQSYLYQVFVRKTASASPVLITDVGFGISQILPVIVLCYYVPEGSTIILEQPEIHLHPSVQAGLADVFIDAIKVRHIQILLESHSEHLLLRLQRRIAEQAEGFGADDIALYFCNYKDSQSDSVSLEVDELGNIRNWPQDFFGDELGERAAMVRAQVERMRPPQ